MMRSIKNDEEHKGPVHHMVHLKHHTFLSVHFTTPHGSYQKCIMMIYHMFTSCEIRTSYSLCRVMIYHVFLHLVKVGQITPCV